MKLSDQVDKGLVSKQFALERLADALPVKNLKKMVIEITKGHDIYFAYGPALDRSCGIIGFWGSLEFKGMAQTLEYDIDSSEKQILAHIVPYAEEMIIGQQGIII